MDTFTILCALAAMVQSEFTSIDDMENLLHLESVYIKSLEKFASEQEQPLMSSISMYTIHLQKYLKRKNR